MSAQPGGYYVPAPSIWPIVGSFGLFFMALGSVFLMNDVVNLGSIFLAAGSLIMIYMMFGWFGTVIGESESGKYNDRVDVSYRWAISWFIF